MKDKINKILELIKLNKFNDAKIIGDTIKKDLEQNHEFLNIYGYILFRLENYEDAIEIIRCKKIGKEHAINLPINTDIYNILLMHGRV